MLLSLPVLSPDEDEDEDDLSPAKDIELLATGGEGEVCIM